MVYTKKGNINTVIKKILIKTEIFKIRDMKESELFIYYLYLNERLKSNEELKIYDDALNKIFYEIIKDERIKGNFLILPLSHFLTFQELGLISYLTEKEKNKYLTLQEKEEFDYENEKRKRESY